MKARKSNTYSLLFFLLLFLFDLFIQEKKIIDEIQRAIVINDKKKISPICFASNFLRAKNFDA